MYKAYRFRLYPNDSQRILIHKTFGCARFVYNYFLDKCKKVGYIKAYDMCKELKGLQEEYPFLKEVDSCSLRCSIFNLEDSYSNFFAKRSGYPCFKKNLASKAIALIVLGVLIKALIIVILLYSKKITK